MRHLAYAALIAGCTVFLTGCTVQKSTSRPRSGGSEIWTGSSVEAPVKWTYDQQPLTPDGWKVRELVKMVTFEQAGASLDREARGVMSGAAEELRKNSAWKILVVGHADRHGELRNAEKLGLRRAQAVVDNLVARGIDTERITVQSLAASQAQAEDFQTQAHQQNRRAEIWALSR